MAEGSDTSVYADEWTLRQRFRELAILDQSFRGELNAAGEDSYPAPAGSGQPPGTLSQRVIYYRGTERVAIVQQYLRPDGTIGGSGLPDPKWLQDGDIVLKYRPQNV